MSHVNIIMLHADIIYLACRRQRYATKRVRMCLQYLLSNSSGGGGVFLRMRPLKPRPRVTAGVAR